MRFFDLNAFGFGEQFRVKWLLRIFPVPVNLSRLVILADYRDGCFRISTREQY